MPRSHTPAPSGAAAPTPLRLILADDHALFADALTIMLQKHWPACTVMHASDTETLLTLLEETEAVDAVLLDFRMPGMESPSSISDIVIAAAPCPVLLVSGLATAADVSRAFEAGVAGFAPKHGHSDALIAALSKVLKRDIRPVESAPLLQTSHTRLIRLSPRELETANFLALGLSNKEIARRMGLSPETIKIYSKSIMTKFRVRNRTEFAMEFIRKGADALHSSDD